MLILAIRWLSLEVTCICVAAFISVVDWKGVMMRCVTFCNTVARQRKNGKAHE